MDPFDLGGPEFLLFYVVACAAIACLVLFLYRWAESGPVPHLGEPDPYLIAYLRGGRNEAMRIAIMSLLDRGLLKQSEASLLAETDAVQRARRPLERALLYEFQTPITAWDVFSKPGPKAACEALAETLRSHALLPNLRQLVARGMVGLAAVVVLWWLGYTKMGIAVSRGHHNTGFLGFLLVATPLVIAFVLRARTTIIGRRLLEDFRTLFARLKDRAEQIPAGGATNELSLLAAVFGLAALPGPALTAAGTLFPKATKTSWSVTLSDWSDTACGAASSCGSSGSSCSSGGSSCGSSCGGGGGCGGCGS